ncbi:cytochrome P450, partial [Streptomyces sp. URMC 123]|uniref:cytochrome P450 n=1 Tax=Streptomyces sp. URMC 123 TaxID=3423403 RepID=UPI003F1BB7A2
TPTTPTFSARPDFFWGPDTEVFHDERLDTWHVFSYGDVLRVLTDASAFSAGYGLDDRARARAHPSLMGLWAAEGARHDDLRAAVAEPFRRKEMERLERSVRSTVTALLDRITAAGTGEVEIVSALARPLPAQVICRLLGLDVSYAERVHAWMDEIYAYSSATQTHSLPPQPDMVDFFTELIGRRRGAERRGLVDDLIAAQEAGHRVAGCPMSDLDLVGYLAMMLSAGVDTTSGSVGNALLFLSEGGHWEELRADPSLIPHAVEEVLRWYPPFPGVRRYVVADTTIGGRRIAAGQWVTGWLTAANRDPARFEDPDTFDIRRRPNPHLSLGHGRHHCLGAPLARLELRVLLEEAVARLPGLRRAPGRPLDRRAWIVDPLDEAHFLFDCDFDRDA